VDVIRYPDAERPASWREPVIALGNFDGLHRGHMAIIERVVASAGRAGRTAALLTFDPHPRRVTGSEHAPRLLMTTRGKLEALESSGLDGVAIVGFTRELSLWSPEQFVSTVLVDWLDVSEVWVGANFLFGRDRAGDVKTLQTLGQRYGFRAERVESVLHNGTVVSSTRIRELAADGRVEEAADLLGRWHGVDGTVVRGDGRGRQIGFPTANLDSDAELWPRTGVYATFVGAAGAEWPAVTNIGCHPTVGACAEPVIETHLLEGGRDLYGQSLRVSFVARLRDERAFDSVDALTTQIADDCQRARILLKRFSV
jgi:riboflavin kinase/FMN adenylyltransferase